MTAYFPSTRTDFAHGEHSWDLFYFLGTCARLIGVQWMSNVRGCGYYFGSSCVTSQRNIIEALRFRPKNFCEDHRAWHNRITGSSRCRGSKQLSKLINRRTLARLIRIYFPLFWKARPCFFRVLQRMTLVFYVTNLKYGNWYDITREKININKRLSDRAK